MKDDLKYLMNIEDDYIFSSISTNKYIVKGDNDFIETCEEMLEINRTLK
jgi:hypothetical protein